MDSKEAWSIFEKTGALADYMAYVATLGGQSKRAVNHAETVNTSPENDRPRNDWTLTQRNS